MIRDILKDLDKDTIEENNKAIKMFERLYLKDFGDEEQRKLDVEIIKGLKKENEEINARHHTRNNTSTEVVSYS